MNRHIFAAALLSLAVASPTMAKPQEVKFTHEGVDYTYSVTNIAADKRVIEGTASPGSPFRLVVSGNRVSGEANGIPVSFRVKPVEAKAAAPVTVASR